MNLGRIKEPYRSLLSRLLDKLLAHFGNNLVSFVIYGSVARGSAKPDSDIDILIVANALPKSRMERQKIFLEVERTLEPEINDLWGKGLHIDFSPIILSVEEARRFRPIYLDMVEDAVIIYDKGDFFKGGCLKTLKEDLRSWALRGFGLATNGIGFLNLT
ncbi:MAG: nucleotidyltransferase domain-containing protein [Candidatus Bathyarchaeia archaeon]